MFGGVIYMPILNEISVDTKKKFIFLMSRLCIDNRKFSDFRKDMVEWRKLEREIGERISDERVGEWTRELI